MNWKYLHDIIQKQRPRRVAGSSWRVRLTLLLGVVFLAGCGGSSSHQMLAEQQLLAARAAPQANQALQEKIMAQGTQASSSSYKDYKIGSEDLLSVEIYGQDSLNRKVRVNGQGEITMPLVGVVKVGGLSPQEAEKVLTRLYNARYLVNPQISVTVQEYRHEQVAVTGAVAKPGSYELIGPRTLLEALAMAGGISGIPSGGGQQAGDVVNVIRRQKAPETASTKAAAAPVQPFAPKTETMVINLNQLVSGQEPGLNITVRGGDVIYVPYAGNVYVLGGVRKPGNVAVKQGLTVSQAVAMAGGVDPILGSDRITIMRFDNQGKPTRIEADLQKIISQKEQDIPIKDNDVVVVNENGLKKSLYIMRTLLPIPTGGYTLGTF